MTHRFRWSSTPKWWWSVEAPTSGGAQRTAATKRASRWTTGSKKPDQKESKIQRNSAARTTYLLEQLFGRYVAAIAVQAPSHPPLVASLVSAPAMRILTDHSLGVM